MRSHPRILAVFPNRRGIGFSVLEGDELVDFALHAPGEKRKDGLDVFRGLLNSYRPDVVLVRKVSRAHRLLETDVPALCEKIQKTCAEDSIRTYAIPRSAVRTHFAGSGVGNKDALAREIARRFPELGRWLPPARALGDAEAHSMGIFDALSLALTYLGCSKSEKRRAARLPTITPANPRRGTNRHYGKRKTRSAPRNRGAMGANDAA